VLGITRCAHIREAPSISLITALQDMGARVRAFDPAGMEQAKLVLPDVTYCDGPYCCADGADGLVIVTEWEQFRALDLDAKEAIGHGERPHHGHALRYQQGDLDLWVIKSRCRCGCR
jgi:UDP-glucose 6-dehydrogenase